MSEIAEHSIYSFGSVGGSQNRPGIEQPFEQPSDPIFTITKTQLDDIVLQATTRLLAEGSETAKKTASLEAKLATLESTLDVLADNDLNQLRLIADLRSQQKRPGNTTISRVAKIERYLSSRPGHKASLEVLRGYIGVDKDLLRITIKALMESSPERYAIVRDHGDRRKRSLMQLPR